RCARTSGSRTPRCWRSRASTRTTFSSSSTSSGPRGSWTRRRSRSRWHSASRRCSLRPRERDAMAGDLVVGGAQRGDGGKGKVVGLLSGSFDVVARYQGGPNAGHTVTIGGARYALQHIPSGVFRKDARIVIGNGTVLDLAKLIREIEELGASGIELGGRLFI